jgi:hypothetical protein
MYSFFLPYTFLATLFLLLKQSSACMHYSATFPYSNSHPFEATITDNGVVTCWISMTYDQHSKQQIAFANRQLGRPQALPPIKPGRIFLTDKPEFSAGKTGNVKRDHGSWPEEAGSNELIKRNGGGGQEGALEDKNYKGVWLNWEFQCLEGYEAHAGIGLRAVWYFAHGREFEFVPECYENVLMDRWEYSIDLWCR